MDFGQIGGPMIWGLEAGHHVAVAKDYAVDQITPITAYIRLRPLGAHTLLESVEGDEKTARYSFVAVGEWARLLEADGQAVLVGPEGTEVSDDPIALLRKQSQRQHIAIPDEVSLPFVGGAVGYFSYDFVRHLETIPNHHPRRGPQWEWVWPKAIVAFDHHRQRATVIVEAGAGQVDQALARLEILVDAMRQPLMLAEPWIQPQGDISSNVTQEQYYAMVDKAKDYIRAGDIFQVVLSQRLSTQIQGDSFNLYRRLRHINPSPYLFYMETPRRTLVGASPEALIRVTDNQVTNRPIAGTRPRGKTAEEDAALWDDLIHDPKERAEHTMLVDLARNDLGRVCEYSSVKINQFMQPERYSHVVHMVSEVEGILRPEFDALDALQATFPAGTLTGAPKIRAMEIIDELEPDSRGAYGGIVGYLSHRGDLDACITIRTLEVEGQTVSVQAGGGIVADSSPEGEFNESMNKAAGALAVLKTEGMEWL